MKKSILLIDPKYPRPEGRRIYFEGSAVTGSDVLVLSDRELEAPGDICAAGYLLSHGGAEFKEDLCPFTDEVLKKIRKCAPHSPEDNSLALKLIRRFTGALPASRHFLLCDTAFFSGLPLKASSYAIPFKMTKSGIRKYGGFGLCHRNAWEKITKTRCGINRLVSVYLGDNTNIAAIRNGNAVETTLGFTSLEGLPSDKTCGDLDSTIIFELYNKGMSFKEINGMLSLASGFRGLAGEKCGFNDLLRGPAAPAHKDITEILQYSIVKYAGAFAAALGGADVVAFSSDNPGLAKEFVSRLQQKLGFLNCEFRALEYNKWEVMSDRILSAL
jgi:acetate kinase